MLTADIYFKLKDLYNVKILQNRSTNSIYRIGENSTPCPVQFCDAGCRALLVGALLTSATLPNTPVSLVAEEPVASSIEPMPEDRIELNSECTSFDFNTFRVDELAQKAENSVELLDISKASEAARPLSSSKAHGLTPALYSTKALSDVKHCSDNAVYDSVNGGSPVNHDGPCFWLDEQLGTEQVRPGTTPFLSKM